LQGVNTIEEKMYDCVQRKGNAVDELYIEMGLKQNANSGEDKNGFTAA
jgi:hypothetical protein